MYYTRKLSLNSQKELCNNLALESGKLYSQTIKFFWRTVRKKNLWLKPSSLMRLFNSYKMHAHSADASVQQFFHALKSWRKVRKTLSGANPPKRLKKYYSVILKNSAIREAKLKLCKKVTNKTRDILHKYTTGLVMYLKNKGYNTLVIGDLRGYRVGSDCGSRRNQENHAWLYSQISWYLKYKWERLGFKFVQHPKFQDRT